MANVNPTRSSVSDLEGAGQIKEADALTTLLNEFNGNVDATNLADADKLGLSGGGVVRRGKSIIATSEGRANVAYGTLTTPDRVTGIVLPTDALMFIAFQGLWLATGTPSSAQARITLNGVAVKAGADAAGSTDVETAVIPGSTNFGHISTHSGGITGASNINASGVQVTTGQIIGSPTSSGNSGGGSAGYGFFGLFAAAGSYTVAVEFRAASGGTVQVKDRKLWVWTMGF